MKMPAAGYMVYLLPGRLWWATGDLPESRLTESGVGPDCGETAPELTHEAVTAGRDRQSSDRWHAKARLPADNLWPRCLANPIVWVLAALTWALVIGVPALAWWAL